MNAASLKTVNLNTVAPLVFIFEEAQKGTLTLQSAGEVAKAALLVLGNASAQTTKERQKKFTISTKIETLADDPEVFKEAAPFCLEPHSRLKEHLGSLRCL